MPVYFFIYCPDILKHRLCSAAIHISQIIYMSLIVYIFSVFFPCRRNSSALRVRSAAGPTAAIF